MKRPCRPLLVLFVLATAYLSFAAQTEKLADGLYAEIATPRGIIVCELWFEKTPLTVASFVGLAEGTLGPEPRKPFFDGLAFHRVVPDFVVQGGDPTATGDGGPGYRFPDEFVPGLRHAELGTLSMANDGPDTNGSQFFLTLRETNRLNYLHTVFGRVFVGHDVLTRVQQGDKFTVKIIRVGEAGRAFRADAAAFATLVAQTKKYNGSAAPGAASHFDDPDRLLPAEPPRAKNFNFKLANYERATGTKIVARLLAQSPPDTDGRKINAYMRELAAKLGVEKTGALAVYVADRDEWKLWIGEDSTAKFMGRAGTVKDFMQGGALHNAKQSFLEAARATGDADFARQKEKAAADKPPPPTQRLKLQTDAVLDGLMQKLEPAL